MKVKELLNEISRGAKKELKRREAEERRAAEKAEQERLTAKIAKARQKKLEKFSKPISATVSKADTEKTDAPFGATELQQYMVDPSIDTSYEGGYYLQFKKVGDDVVAYWSRNPDATLEQMRTFKQFVNLGSTFNHSQFESLLQKLITASGDRTNTGYVQVVISPNQASNLEMISPKSFFRNLIYYLSSEYPRNAPTVSATVGWEIS